MSVKPWTLDLSPQRDIRKVQDVQNNRIGISRRLSGLFDGTWWFVQETDRPFTGSLRKETLFSVPIVKASGTIYTVVKKNGA